MRNANRLDSEKCNAALLEKGSLDTAETEPRQVCCTIRACDPCFGIVSGLARKGDHVTSPERGERENEPVLDLKRTLISEGNANNNFKCCTLRARNQRFHAGKNFQELLQSATWFSSAHH